MTNPNDPDFRREYQRDPGPGNSFTGATWASLAFILLLFGGVALWAYASGDMQTSALKRPATEQGVPPTTTGQGGAATRIPAKE